MTTADHEEKILHADPLSQNPPPSYPHSPADYGLHSSHSQSHNRNPSANSNNNGNGNYSHQLHTAQRHDSVSVLGSEVDGAGPHDSVSALGSEVYSPPAQYQNHDPSRYPHGVDSEAQFQYPQAVVTHDPASAPVASPQQQQEKQYSQHPQPQQQQHQQQYPVMAQQQQHPQQPQQPQQQQQQQHPAMAQQHQHPHPHQQQPYVHPTAYGQQGGEWQASLCDCSPCSSCMLGWCCPCILLGQTSERIRDPSMRDADVVNGDCVIHGLITCFTTCGWIYAMFKRSEIRERYNIKGSGCGDCCVSYCCPCCALIQQDNEVKIRQRNAAPVQQGYQSQPGMAMPAPAPAYYPQK